MARCPWMDSITLTSNAVVYNLLTLLQAIDSAIPKHAQSVSLQVDIGAGGAKVYVGNSNVASTHCGAALVATQSPTIIGYDSNLVILKDIYLTSDTNSIQVNVIVVTR